MAETKVTDVIVPAIFNPAFVERTAAKFAFLQAGIVRTPPPNMPIPLGAGGTTIQLPFFQDLTGNDNIWTDTADITLNKITMLQDTATILTREKAWGATDLSAYLSGEDPMGTILDLVAGYWSRRYQAILLAAAAGATSSASMSANVLDISALSGAAAYIDGDSFVDATTKLGDSGDDLTVIAVHSAVEGWLRKNDLIAFTVPSEGAAAIRTFQGRRVVVDDSMPFSSGKYTSYLFGPGAFTLVDQEFPEMTEPARHPEKSGGTDALYTRRRLCLHPRGIRWIGTPAALSASNAELQTGTNWNRVWEAKNVKIVKFIHKVG
jgi:hypothetical protein